jgi:hypothetical protein
MLSHSHPSHLLTDFRQNDTVSYCKEVVRSSFSSQINTNSIETEGVDYNIIAVLQRTGLTPQEAFDRVAEMLKDAYRDWYLALARLPQWGEEIDRQVQKYIHAMENIVRADLNWRQVFRSRLDFNSG